MRRHWVLRDYAADGHVVSEHLYRFRWDACGVLKWHDAFFGNKRDGFELRLEWRP